MTKDEISARIELLKKQNDEDREVYIKEGKQDGSIRK